MNDHQRGIYQPLADNAPLYDLSDDDADEEEERSRLPLMIVVALVVLAAFTGVVWLAYNQGVARGRTGNAVVINAPDGPVRVAPSDGNGGTAFTGLKIYNQPVPPDQEAAASSLAKEPTKVASAAPVTRPAISEAPQVRLDPGPPAPPPRPAAQAVAPPAPAPAAPKAAPTVPPPPARPAVAQAVPPPAAPQPPAPPPPARPAVAQATPAPPPPAAAPAPTQAPPPAARPAPVSQPSPAAVATPASGGSVAVSGGAVLQIGSFENPALAEGAWKAFKARYSNVVGDLSEDIQKADLGARGTFYRLRAGPFKDRPAAVAVCEKLKTQGASCLVTAP